VARFLTGADFCRNEIMERWIVILNLAVAQCPVIAAPAPSNADQCAGTVSLDLSLGATPGLPHARPESHVHP
jgi:hypothetical protein